MPDLRNLTFPEARAALLPILKKKEWRLVWQRMKVGIPLLPIIGYLRIRLPNVLWLIAFILFVGIVWVGGLYLERREITIMVRKQLCRWGKRVCLHCGYDMRGSMLRCPECGTVFGETSPPLEGDSDTAC